MRKPLRRTLIILFLLACLLLTSTAIVGADSFAKQDTSTWRWHTGDGLSLRAPSNWLSYDDPAFTNDISDAAIAGNPQVAATIGQAQSGDFASYLVDSKTFGNISITVVDVGLALSLSMIQNSFSEQYPEAGITILDDEYIDLPIGETWRIKIDTPFNVSGNELRVEQFQYIVIEGNFVYIVTMNVGTGNFDNYRDFFERIADTFTFGDVEDTPEFVKYNYDNFSFSAPANWLPLDDPALTDEVLTSVIANNPQVLATIEQALAGDFITYMIEPDISGSMNLNLIDLGVVVTLEDVEGILYESYPDLGVEILTTDVISLPIGGVLRAYVEVTFAGGSTLEQYQYFVVDGQLVHAMTMNSGIEPVEDYFPLFEQIAASFEFTSNSSDSVDVNGTTSGGSGWVRYESDDFVMEVPESWLDMRGDNSLDAAIEQVLEANPELREMYDLAQSGDFSIYLLDPLTYANMNQSGMDLGSNIDLPALEQALLEQYPDLGLLVVDTEIVEFPIGEVLRVYAKTPVNIPGGSTMVTEQYQYVFMEETMLYFVTFTGGVGDFTDYVVVFEQVMESLELK
jgi:hypothetical protein